MSGLGTPLIDSNCAAYNLEELAFELSAAGKTCTQLPRT